MGVRSEADGLLIRILEEARLLMNGSSYKLSSIMVEPDRGRENLPLSGTFTETFPPGFSNGKILI